MNCPRTYWITDLLRIATQIQTSHPTLKWTPARPMGLQSIGLRVRLKAAWLVFTGKADAVRWFQP